MGRPKTMNAAFGEFISTVMHRFNELLTSSPTWVPDKEQAEVLKRLAETQAILQKGLEDDTEKKLPTKAQRTQALAALESRPAPNTGAPEPEAEA